MNYGRLCICLLFVTNVWLSDCAAEQDNEAENVLKVQSLPNDRVLYVVTVPIALDLLDQPGSDIVVSPSAVKIYLEGRRDSMTNVKEFPIGPIILSLSPADTTVTLDRSTVRIPRGLNAEIVRIEPSQVSIKSLFEKTVPFQVLGQVQVPPDRLVVEQQVEPSEVMLRGPSSVVSGIGSLALDLSQIRSVKIFILNVRLEIALPESLIGVVSVYPDSVSIRARITYRDTLQNRWHP